MKVSFKQFSSFVDTPDEELTEEQLTEIFGLFANNKKVDDFKAKRAELLAQKDAKKKEIDAKNAERLKKMSVGVAAAKQKLNDLNPGQMRAGQLRALDRNPFAESVKKVDYSTVEIDGVDRHDYPDFSDAYASYAEYTDGTELTDEELEKFTNENSDFINEKAHESFH